jgi:hypothetical protein
MNRFCDKVAPGRNQVFDLAACDDKNRITLFGCARS